MKLKLLDTSLPLLLPAVILLHLLVAPDTKVEESFNLQAVHDVLVYGTPTGPGAAARLAARYDHATFPGAVPRTFVGAVVLAGVGKAVLDAGELLGLVRQEAVSGPALQTLVRAVLGLANAAALVALGRALGRRRGPRAARWFYLLQAAQFHVVFYASRTLPNAFALFLTTLAWAALVHAESTGALRVALTLLTFAGVVFRAEVALLLAAVAAYLLVVPLASLQQVVRTVALAAGAALALTVPIDTYFWQANATFGVYGWRRPLWPELHAFLFNAWHGHASEWGMLPWHWYATDALPRLLLNPALWLVGLPAAFLVKDRRDTGVDARTTAPALAARLTVPSLLFVALYSRQPHKEARFVLYVVPALTAAAALGADQLWAACWTEPVDDKTKKTDKTAAKNKATKPTPSYPVLVATAVLALSIPLALAASTAMLLVSALNYPGGDALAVLRDLVQADMTELAARPAHHHHNNASSLPWTLVTAHADVLACMTGVTLFGSTLGPGVPTLADAFARRDAARAAVRTDDYGLYHQYDHDGQAWAAGLPTHQVVVVENSTDAATVVPEPSTPSTVPPPPLLVVDKTEHPGALADPAFWAQFDYVLAEAPESVPGGGGDWFETVGVVHGYAGVEVLRPGGLEEEEEEEGSVPLVGRGVLLARVRRAVRARTGGWWVGPRTAPRVYVLRRVRTRAGAGAGARHQVAAA